MGFWDNFKTDEAGGAGYITKAEKEDLIDNGTPLEVVAVEYGDNPFAVTEKDGSVTAPYRYVVTAIVDGAERKLSFVAGSVDSRDRLLAALAEYLEDEGKGATVTIALERQNRSVLIVPA